MTANSEAGTLAPSRRNDDQAHAAASSFLGCLVRSSHVCVHWDPTHHLEGHAIVGGCELVVIAPRDYRHGTLVVTAADWDEIRRASQDQRRELLGVRPITSADRLREIVRHEI
jgi:hypothetical protein